MPLRFVHCSDIHLLELTGNTPQRFFNKRLTGGVNVLFNRSRKYSGSMFQGIVAAAQAHGAERLVITGDLTNLALQSEFEHVKQALEAVPMPVTVIPGNHDA